MWLCFSWSHLLSSPVTPRDIFSHTRIHSMFDQLSSSEGECKELRVENQQLKGKEDSSPDGKTAMQQRVKFLEKQMADLLAERNMYRDRCDTLSQKMKKQASDVLEKNSTASTKDESFRGSESSAVSSRGSEGERHWSMQV